MLKEVLALFVLVSSIPAGFILAWLTSDELKQGKKYFKVIVILAGVFCIISIIFKSWELLLTFAYMAIVTCICWKKA